jgi:hypothetical protein
MSKIAEVYIHLQIDPSNEFHETSKVYLFQHANMFANKLFQGEPKVYIRVEEGSYKAWITVVSAVYIAISGYGSFRSGIDHLVNDARNFSEYVISDFISESKISKEKIVRLERRLGISGKIQRILKRIDNLGTNISLKQSMEIIDGKPVSSQNVVISQDKEEIENIKNEIIRIFELLENDKDRKLFFESLPDNFKNEMPDDFAEWLLNLPRKDIYLKEDELFLELPIVKKLPPPD